MHVLPTRKAEELYRGSYEELIQQIESAVRDGHRKFGSDDPESLSLIATFPGRALVMTEDGTFFRAQYERVGNGTVSFSLVEEVEVGVLRSQKERVAFVHEAAGSAVASLFSGDYSDARERIRELMNSSEFVRPSVTLEDLRTRIESVFDDSRPWRVFFEEHGPQVRKFMWGASGAIVRHAPRPKYGSLYTGASPTDPEGYFESVGGDLEVLHEKVSNLWSMVSAAQERYPTGSGKFNNVELMGIAEQFDGFATDFIDELKMIARLVEQAVLDKNEDNTVARAMIYDRVAAMYPDMEIATRFIQRISTELAV